MQHVPIGTGGSCVPPTHSLPVHGWWLGEATHRASVHPPQSPRSRSADFQPVPGTPQVLYTTPFLTSPHRVCGDRHPGNGVEAVGQGKLSPTTAALGGSSPTPCMLIPRAPQSYHLRLCTHSVLSEMFQGVGEGGTRFPHYPQLLNWVGQHCYRLLNTIHWG